MLRISAIFAALVLTGSLAWAGETPAPEGARVYFVSRQNGETVGNPVKAVFGLKGMGVAPAGVEKEKTGHHHLLIDTDPPSLHEPIPADDNHKHFGGDQTETEVQLSPGQNSLQLLLGDQNHIPHNPPVLSDKITITVK